MSYLGDVLGFEKFNLEDMLKGLKKHPLQKLAFGIDPLGTKIGNTITGNNDQPLVDQLGGAYGGKVLSVGNPTGGVYGRAQAAGINTGPGSNLQDLAHVVAAAYGAAGLGGIGGAPPAGGQAGAGLGKAAAATANPASAYPEVLIGGGQAPAAAAPVQAAQAAPSLWSRLQGGLGKLNSGLANRLFPTGGPEQQGLTAEQQQALQRQAMQQFGLQLLGNIGNPRGFGAGVQNAAAVAGGGLSENLQLAQRQIDRQQQQAYQTARDTKLDTRYEQDQAYRASQDRIANAQRDQVRLDALKENADRIAVQREALNAKPQMSAKEKADLARAEADQKRASELLAKPNRTESEEIELNALTRGAVADYLNAKTKANGGFGAGGPPVQTYNPATGKFE